MSLRQFEYALTVATEGSVTAAAESLRVAQPSMACHRGRRAGRCSPRLHLPAPR
ncbi:LysR family transcriptional regulator [Nonomuraea sp. NPDC050202]|uniref:LysR family transcriptional regulator n=1 Tax=Nonomuraea sp. NPDC050202 TaxID=3155035 RepID=UPI0033DF32E6